MSKYLYAILATFLFTHCESQPATQNTKAGAQPEYAENFNLDWATNQLWDDGKGEVATYHAERTVYNKKRHFDYVFILVKETFNETYNVKTDDYNRDDLFDVMKINKFADIPTQVYPYHYLTSIFLKREEPTQVHKFTNSSQEWCGNTFKLFHQKPYGYEYTYHSYWDGQGDGSMKLANGFFLFEDQLSYTLRTLKFEDSLSFDAPIVPSQVSSRAEQPKIYQATIQVSQEAHHNYDTITSQPLWHIEVGLAEGKTNHYWIKPEYPNHLVAQETWDGRNLYLKTIKRWKYWAVE